MYFSKLQKKTGGEMYDRIWISDPKLVPEYEYCMIKNNNDRLIIIAQNTMEIRLKPTIRVGSSKGGLYMILWVLIY